MQQVLKTQSLWSLLGELSEHSPGEEHPRDTAQVPQLDTTRLHL